MQLNIKNTIETYSAFYTWTRRFSIENKLIIIPIYFLFVNSILDQKTQKRNNQVC